MGCCNRTKSQPLIETVQPGTVRAVPLTVAHMLTSLKDPVFLSLLPMFNTLVVAADQPRSNALFETYADTVMTLAAQDLTALKNYFGVPTMLIKQYAADRSERWTSV